MATAPKSNASYNAINAALADVDARTYRSSAVASTQCANQAYEGMGQSRGVPLRARLAWRGGPQQYMPDELVGREYYHPNDRGYEHEVSARLAKIRPILHGEDDKGGR